MTIMEIILIVAAAAVPIVTLLFVLPKKKNASKEEKPTEKPVEKTKNNAVAENKPSEVESNTKIEAKPEKTVRPVFDSVDYKAEDFRNYLKEKSNTISRPKRKVKDSDFKDLSQGWESFMKTPVPPQKSLSDDICCLSTEVQAMIFAGILDKRF